MKSVNKLILFGFLFFGALLHAQVAFVKGIVLSENNEPIANVVVSANQLNARSAADGSYTLQIPANVKAKLVFSHLSFKSLSIDLMLQTDEYFVFNPVLKTNVEQMGEVIITTSNNKSIVGVTNLSVATVKKIPGANGGIENVLKTLPGVNSNNEFSTQYAVRGGNYDENLVYINDVEVYRPFLIRSGQQEGLSFVNSDLVQNIDFSAGGFQAKYGDKLSSVLDISYRKPKENTAYLQASFLGVNTGADWVSKNKKLTGILGVRYRNNSLLVNSQDTQTNYKPIYIDAQTNVNFQISDKWDLSFLGSVSENQYNYQPLVRQTKFGTSDQQLMLNVFYEGQEKDTYRTYFGALTLKYKVSDNSTIKVIGSLYHTQEQEHFDILGQYVLKPVDAEVGDVDYATGIGTQLNHARNDLDALIGNFEVKGKHLLQSITLDWGAKYTYESIRDRIVEWEMVDSAGFALQPPMYATGNNQPYEPYVGPLVPFQSIRATNRNSIHRFTGYAQASGNFNLGKGEMWYSAGLRFQNWQVLDAAIDGTAQTVISPRGLIAFKPQWEQNMIFRLSGGYYYQPPFYRELRDYQGNVNPNVKAQQSIHVVFSHEYNFEWWKRPFKLVSELYYKQLADVNTYNMDNVRIRYVADNNAEAYAQGLDVRLNGEFVPGTESWLSFGYMKTEENYADKGFIARPTDQRLKFAMLFQDYMPNIPSMKLYLNLVYNTGLPGGAPSYTDPYEYQNRLKDYRRVDVGFSKVFIDEKNRGSKNAFWKTFRELALGVEIFNLFDNLNAITNTWVRDVYSKNQYAVPNYMTSRVFNIKLNVRL